MKASLDNMYVRSTRSTLLTDETSAATTSKKIGEFTPQTNKGTESATHPGSIEKFRVKREFKAVDKADMTDSSSD